MPIVAILRDAEGVEQNRVKGDDIDVVRVMVESFLLPGAGPGDRIEFERQSDELPNCVWHNAETPFAENH